jgi:hypothetical protein
MSSNKQLFKYHLDLKEKAHNTRPQFIFRSHRLKFDTKVLKPISFFAPWYSTSGWFMKGAAVYFAYYWLFKKTPYTKHWNREGYEYEVTHKAPFYQY